VIYPKFSKIFSCILKEIYIQEICVQENMMIIFSLSILGFKFLFFLQHFSFSIQGGGLHFIFWDFKTTFLKWVCGERLALAPFHSQVPMKSPHPVPTRSDQTILLLVKH
jgi:hypothetical protein